MQKTTQSLPKLNVYVYLFAIFGKVINELPAMLEKRPCILTTTYFDGLTSYICSFKRRSRKPIRVGTNK